MGWANNQICAQAGRFALRRIVMYNVNCVNRHYCATIAAQAAQVIGLWRDRPLESPPTFADKGRSDGKPTWANR
jgi:hypothetical protein